MSSPQEESSGYPQPFDDQPEGKVVCRGETVKEAKLMNVSSLLDDSIIILEQDNAGVSCWV